MRKLENHLERLIAYLRIQGIARSDDVITNLGISKATLSRATQSLPPQLIVLGKASSTLYALLKELPSLSSELPVFRVDEKGNFLADSKIYLCCNQKFIWEPGLRKYSGMPPELAEMSPQGFMGRAFAQRFSNELNLPQHLADWSTDHFLIALSLRGEDLPGNLIIGQESGSRYRKLQYASSAISDYPGLANSAIQGQPAGSSAGGEQSKFSTIRDGRHFLVKFAGMDSSASQTRWKDLLVCEYLALELLRSNGLLTAKAQIHEVGSMFFLEIERFDRVGLKGRKAILTLASIDDHYFGKRDQWSLAADRFYRGNLISETDSNHIKLLDSFGALIADTDRHFHNLAFFPDKKFKDRFSLAPAFDKLPMFYAPVGTQIVQRVFEVPIPNASMINQWEKARKLAIEYWGLVAREPRITSAFRNIAKENQKLIK